MHSSESFAANGMISARRACEVPNRARTSAARNAPSASAARWGMVIMPAPLPSRLLHQLDLSRTRACLMVALSAAREEWAARRRGRAHLRQDTNHSPARPLGHSLRRLTRYRVLDQADHRRDDRPGGASAHGLAEHRADIDAAAGAGEHRNEGGENLPAARAADGAGDRVAERAEVDLFERVAERIAAGGSGDQLNEEIDDRGRHACPPSIP